MAYLVVETKLVVVATVGVVTTVDPGVTVLLATVGTVLVATELVGASVVVKVSL